MMRRLLFPLLLTFIAAASRAQIPNEIAEVKRWVCDQSSATALVTLGYSITFYATYPTTVPTTATVDVHIPGGALLRLTRGDGGLFIGSKAYQSRAYLESAYPDGAYSAVLSVGAVTATTDFAVMSGPDTPPLVISNYDGLQGSTTSRPRIEWQTIPGATAQDSMGIAVTQTDGTAVFSSTTLDATSGGITVSVPNGTPLRAGLAYVKFNSAYVNSGATEIRTGRSTSVGFSLSANVPAPLIWEQPAGAHLVTGSYYNLRVTATGNDSPTYQWYKDGAPIRNATAPNYPMTARLTDSGSYTVSVTNPGGTVMSDPAAIAVEDQRPVIEAQPVAMAVGTGEPATLRVQATGTGTLTYQWYRDGAAIPGATEAALAFSSTQPADAGTYTVAVTDANGTTMSMGAALALGTSVHVTTYAGTGAAAATDGPANVAAFKSPAALGRDARGNFYVVDCFAIRKISTDGTVSTFAGQVDQQGFADGVGSAARFHDVRGLAIDPSGNVYVSDSDTIRRITPAGVVTTVAGAPGTFGAADGAGTGARFILPSGLATDAGGNVYVADSGNHTVRKMTADGVVSTVAGTAAVSGTSDGVGDTARFESPRWVALDPTGGVIVADGSTALRRIGTDGTVTTVAGMSANRTFFQDGIGVNAGIDTARDAVAVAPDGTIYFMDNQRLRRVTPGGVVQTIAGGRGLPFADGYGLQANFGTTGGIVVGASGTLFVADTGNCRIRKVTFEGTGSATGIVFQQQPSSHTVAPGGIVVLTASASGSVAYGTWEKNGVAIAGATAPALTLRNATAADTGTYTYVAANLAGTFSTRPALVNVSASATPSRIVNLSVRSAAGLASDTLLVGFAAAGPGAPKPVLARAIGPALTSFGVAHALPDPTLTVNSATGAIATNDDWTSDVGDTFSRVGAFPLTAGSADAAATVTLQPGTYTLQVGNKNHPGVAAAEIYDLDAVTTPGCRLVNASARTHVGTGDSVLIAGFTVLGDTSETLLIRGVGRSLQNYGISSSECLADPEIEVRSGGAIVAANDNWGNDPQLHSAFQAVGAFDLSSATDAAVLVTLNPGTYTVEVEGVNDTTGVALVEVYEMP